MPHTITRIRLPRIRIDVSTTSNRERFSHPPYAYATLAQPEKSSTGFVRLRLRADRNRPTEIRPCLVGQRIGPYNSSNFQGSLEGVEKPCHNDHASWSWRGLTVPRGTRSKSAGRTLNWSALTARGPLFFSLPPSISTASTSTPPTRRSGSASAHLFQAEGILETLGEGVALIDLQLRITWANLMFEAWCDGPVSGRGFYEALGSPQILGPDYSPFHTALGEGQAVITRLHTRQNRYLELLVTPIRDTSGKVSQLICLCRDVTAAGAAAAKARRPAPGRPRAGGAGPRSARRDERRGAHRAAQAEHPPLHATTCCTTT